jgi:hypothetical protein
MFKAIAFAAIMMFSVNAFATGIGNTTNNDYDQRTYNSGGNATAGAVAGAVAGAAAGASVNNANTIGIKSYTDIRNEVRNTNTNVNAVSNKQGQQQGQGQLQGQGQQQSAKSNQSQSADNNGNAQSMTYNEAAIPTTTTQNINYSGLKDNTPSIALGGLYPSSPCMGTSNVGGSGPGFSIGFGTSWKDDDCGYRETARSFAGMGLKDDAIAILCASAYAKAAPSCAGKAVAPVKAATIEVDHSRPSMRKTSDVNVLFPSNP